MAIAAVHSCDRIANIRRMDKSFYLAARLYIFLFLAQNGVTEVTSLGSDLAVRRLVFPAGAAEAAGSVEMAYVIRIGVPSDFHAGKEVSAIDVLDVFYGLPDGWGFFFCQPGIIFGIMFFYAFGDGVFPFFLGLIGFVK